jgi:hypothetical protein
MDKKELRKEILETLEKDRGIKAAKLWELLSDDVMLVEVNDMLSDLRLKNLAYKNEEGFWFKK